MPSVSRQLSSDSSRRDDQQQLPSSASMNTAQNSNLMSTGDANDAINLTQLLQQTGDDQSSLQSHASSSQQAQQVQQQQQQQQQQQPPRSVLTISCTHCRLTLSFRGMEAVLVTQPVTRCYSTDMCPINCIPIGGNGGISVGVASPGHDSAPFSFSPNDGYGQYSSAIFSNGYGRRHSYGPGSCECLIQSMACYGCGNTVGYYIQRPCQRCVQRRLRTRAYFHLWVFNSADTEAEQRYRVARIPLAAGTQGSSQGSANGIVEVGENMDTTPMMASVYLPVTWDDLTAPPPVPPLLVDIDLTDPLSVPAINWSKVMASSGLKSLLFETSKRDKQLQRVDSFELDKDDVATTSNIRNQEGHRIHAKWWWQLLKHPHFAAVVAAEPLLIPSSTQEGLREVCPIYQIIVDALVYKRTQLGYDV